MSHFAGDEAGFDLDLAIGLVGKLASMVILSPGWMGCISLAFLSFDRWSSGKPRVWAAAMRIACTMQMPGRMGWFAK